MLAVLSAPLGQFIHLDPGYCRRGVVIEFMDRLQICRFRRRLCDVIEGDLRHLDNGSVGGHFSLTGQFFKLLNPRGNIGELLELVRLVRDRLWRHVLGVKACRYASLPLPVSTFFWQNLSSLVVSAVVIGIEGVVC